MKVSEVLQKLENLEGDPDLVVWDIETDTFFTPTTAAFISSDDEGFQDRACLLVKPSKGEQQEEPDRPERKVWGNE